MPTLEENKKMWTDYHWRAGGQEWSGSWGNAEMQWHASLLPRLHRFLPTGTILEIAPGFGRWTQYLKDLCDTLIVVDLSKPCIDACRERFKDERHITYHLNDGLSLEMIPNESIDFVFSYDSLVHAEEDVIAAYLQQLAKKLRPNGVGFIHHSNAGRYAWYFRLFRHVGRAQRLVSLLQFLRIPFRYHLRGLTVTAEKFAALAAAAGLRCLSQEIINWRSSFFFFDCHSVIARAESPWPRGEKVIENRHFMDEARSIALMSELYSGLSNDPERPDSV